MAGEEDDDIARDPNATMDKPAFEVEGVGNVNILDMDAASMNTPKSEAKGEHELEQTAREPELNQIREEPNQEDDDGSQKGENEEGERRDGAEGDADPNAEGGEGADANAEGAEQEGD